MLLMSILRSLWRLPLVVFALCMLFLMLLPTPQVASAVQTDTATPAPTALPINFSLLKGHIDQQIQSYMTDKHIVSCAFAAVYPDSTNNLQTQILNYGTLSKDSKTVAGPSTLYEIGSLSKLFAANLLVKFVQNGLMQLEDPLQKYLPTNVHVPTFKGQEITLRELATHTSGLPRNLGTGLGIATINGALTVGYMSADDVYKFLSSYTLTYAPGSKWEYSNLAFGLLGMAEEKAGNDSFENLVLKWITGPLGLQDTRAKVLLAEKPFLAQGYNAANNRAAPFAVNGELIAAGGLRSSIKDLAMYLAANIDPASSKMETVLNQTLERQTDGPNSNIDQTLGWSIAAPGTPNAEFTKAGSTSGFSSYIAFSKIARSGFVIVCNGANVSKILSGPLSKIMGQTETSLDDNE